MILGFMTKFPWGKETDFIIKIIYPYMVYNLLKKEYQQRFGKPKIHTVRSGNRITPGTLLHMATGTRTPKYFQFNKGIPQLDKCISVQGIRIYSEEKEVWVAADKRIKRSEYYDVCYKRVDAEEFSKNDGFDSQEDFWKYFSTDFFGNIIHWTNHLYR